MAHCESFNGKLRDELLNGEIFYTWKEVKIVIEKLASSLRHSPPALIPWHIERRHPRRSSGQAQNR